MAKVSPVFSGIKVDEGIETAATRKGVALKTALLLMIAIASAIIGPLFLAKLDGNMPLIVVVVALIAALICSFVGQLVPQAAMVASLIYSVCEGLVLGLISYVIEAYFEYSGIVLTAILVTAAIFAVTLLLYSTGIVKVTRKFMFIAVTFFVTGFLLMFIYWIASIINPNNILALTYGAYRGIMIAVSAFCLLYGCFMLTLNFSYIDQMVANGFDKKYEWCGALGLMVCIVYIYLEVLRLLIIIMGKRD